MNRRYFEQLPRCIPNSEEVIFSVVNVAADIAVSQRVDATEKEFEALWQNPTFEALWQNPTSEQRDLIKRRAMTLAVLCGAKNGDKLYWLKETFVIALTEKQIQCIQSIFFAPMGAVEKGKEMLLTDESEIGVK